MNKQSLIGVLVAPLVAPILYQICLMIFKYDSIPDLNTLITNAFIPLLVISLPISYGAMLLLGLPLIWFLKRINYINFYSVTTCAAILGATIMWAVYGSISLSNDGWSIIFWYPVLGSFLGFSVATVFCLIAGITKRSEADMK